MTAIKSHQAEQFLKTLGPRCQAILVFGTDAGLVLERAQTAARRLAAATQPPGELLRIEDSDLENDPDRLLVEVQTMPMFGGPKVVQTRASRRVTAQVLKPLLDEGALAASLVVEAGNLRPDDALRGLFEKSKTAAAIPCYADEARDLDGLVRETLRQAGMAIAPEAQQALVNRLGADRALSRAELEKLLLYAQGSPRIELEHVDAIVGDASELAIEKVVLAAASGQAGRAVAEYDRVIASGESPQTVIAAVQRHFQRLHRIRMAIEAGRSMDDAMRQIRPPIHFKARPQLEAQCRAWSSGALIDALSRIGQSARAARLNSALESALAERLILDLASLAAERPPGRSGGV
ncbi:MAG: DNA polymerase III subunit delta [Hyphomicrobiaceae bacterium]|nr:DNA polymerase III subunit delta [Hyphomicrobiaceae bacterium]